MTVATLINTEVTSGESRGPEHSGPDGVGIGPEAGGEPRPQTSKVLSLQIEPSVLRSGLLAEALWEFLNQNPSINRVAVGRAPELNEHGNLARVALPVATVSKFHLELDYSDRGRVKVVDQESTHGTFYLNAVTHQFERLQSRIPREFPVAVVLRLGEQPDAPTFVVAPREPKIPLDWRNGRIQRTGCIDIVAADLADPRLLGADIVARLAKSERPLVIGRSPSSHPENGDALSSIGLHHLSISKLPEGIRVVALDSRDRTWLSEPQKGYYVRVLASHSYFSASSLIVNLGGVFSILLPFEVPGARPRSRSQTPVLADALSTLFKLTPRLSLGGEFTFETPNIARRSHDTRITDIVVTGSRVAREHAALIATTKRLAGFLGGPLSKPAVQVSVNSSALGLRYVDGRRFGQIRPGGTKTLTSGTTLEVDGIRIVLTPPAKVRLERSARANQR